MLDPDGAVHPLRDRNDSRKANVTIDADGFSHTRSDKGGSLDRGFKLAAQV